VTARPAFSTRGHDRAAPAALEHRLEGSGADAGVTYGTIAVILNRMAAPPSRLPPPVRVSLRTAGRVARDPRTAGLAAAAPRTAFYLARTWARSRRPPTDPDGPPAGRVTAGLAAQVLLDEVMLAALKNPKLYPRGDDIERAGAETGAAVDLYTRRSWLADPASYHRDPPPPNDTVVDRRRVLDVRFEHVRFPSGFEPHAGEPGGERYLSYEANHTVHVWVLRHRGGPRPWLVCLHGFGMGQPYLDLRGFRARQLYRLGLNIAVPVLPLHGPRTTSRVRGEGFMTANLIDSVHGLAQSAWDVRRTIGWLRGEHAAAGVGVYGLSLGGYVAALVAALEEGLDCSIAGIPVVDLPAMYRRHSPPGQRRRAERAGALGEPAQAVHRVVSPLAMPPRVPHPGRFVFAGFGDRMATFGQARRLWEHWERPQSAWYGGGHVGFFWSGAVTRFVADALTSSALLPSPALEATR
jgi:dienelactone hydrolase